MKESRSVKSKKGEGRAEARRVAGLVQQAIADGADTVEKIHRSIAALPLDVLERLDLFEKTVKDVRKVQDTSIGAIYDLIHKVNREVGELAQELLEAPPARKAAPRTASRARGASAHAR